MDFKQPRKQAELKETCATCGKPVLRKAQSDVTRFLSSESRCTCISESESAAKSPDKAIQLSAQQISELQANLGERYEVQNLLGQGGMGAVYKVRDRQVDKTFAIKVLNPQLVEDASSVKRFEQEARAAVALTHPNLVAVYDFGMGHTGAPYIVMDYLDGESLAQRLSREGYLDVPTAQDILVQLAEAMAHAHDKGVIHRDIKPTNIMISKRDGIEFAKLVDFGIAKVMPSESRSTQMTQTGEIFGSPLYMSPEQGLGNRLDARSDIYAFGCVAYEALTGIAPFAAENPIKTIFRHVNETATPFSSLKQDFNIPIALEQVILRCLEKDPNDRYQTAHELESDLRALIAGRPLAGSKKKPSAKTEKPKNLLKVGLVCLVLLGVIAYFVFQSINAKVANAPVGGSAITDAQQLDQLSYKYFVNGDYERAIPLLEFGVKTYQEGGKHLGPNGAEDTYLADNYQHIGKCYLMLKKPSEAVDYYRKALIIYRKFGNYRGGMMPEAVSDYAKVLRLLGRDDAARKLESDFAANKNLIEIP